MHTSSDTIVLNNLPIYFIWFSSDIPPKYFGNLLRAAKTNKSRDIILVYSEKHLLPNNRKNIDSMNCIKIEEIKERVKLKRNNETQNLFKIDVYDMELDKQDERIYGLFNSILKIRRFYGIKKTSFKYCIASDIIRLPILNITGGIYLDMDTEVIGKIGKIENKNGFGLHYYYDNDSLEFTGNFLIKVNKKDDYFDSLIKQYFSIIKNFIISGFGNETRTDPAMHLCNDIFRHYLLEYVNLKTPAVMQERKRKFQYHYDKRSKAIQYTLITDDDDLCKFSFSFEGKDETCLSYIKDQSILNYGIHVPQAIKLKMEQGEGYNADYNNPKDLKKLGLDEQDYDISDKLENFSLEQPGSSQEKGR